MAVVAGRMVTGMLAYPLNLADDGDQKQGAYGEGDGLDVLEGDHVVWCPYLYLV